MFEEVIHKSSFGKEISYLLSHQHLGKMSLGSITYHRDDSSLVVDVKSNCYGTSLWLMGLDVNLDAPNLAQNPHLFDKDISWQFKPTDTPSRPGYMSGRCAANVICTTQEITRPQENSLIALYTEPNNPTTLGHLAVCIGVDKLTQEPILFHQRHFGDIFEVTTLLGAKAYYYTVYKSMLSHKFFRVSP
jgi:hypothetical protein